jgi:hypothetical protein
MKCSNYGSFEVIKPRLSGLAFVISVLLLGSAITFISKRYYCID